MTNVLTAPRSSWQNGVIERFIGSVRRECLDHVIIFNANGLQRILKSYMEYYERSRTHLALQKDAPVSRPVSPTITGRIIAIPQVRGLHHRYERGRVINSIIHSCERRYAVATALRRNSRFPSWLVGKPCSRQTESPTNRCHTCPMDPRSSFQQRQAVRAGDSVHMTPTVMRSRPTVGGS